MAAGVFRRLVHRVAEDGTWIRLKGLTFWVADCGAMAIPTTRPCSDWTWCAACWAGLSPAIEIMKGLKALDEPIGDERSATTTGARFAS